MGIDIGGGMIVGNWGDEIALPEDYEGSLTEYAEENGMDYLSAHYDADESNRVYGFRVKQIEVRDINDSWITDIRSLAEEFERLTGAKAILIGMQNVW